MIRFWLELHDGRRVSTIALLSGPWTAGAMGFTYDETIRVTATAKFKAGDVVDALDWHGKGTLRSRIHLSDGCRKGDEIVLPAGDFSIGVT